ncbi:MAG: type II secretion system ATPase GspE [Candidatus Omnitrophica bacterium]|nr:type II secretion system ATPase GspE [Candidatus Omnitrophota bacterium]
MADTGKLLGQVLKNLGLVTEAQIQEAIQVQQKEKDKYEKLGQVLVKLGYLRAQDLTKALASQYGMPTLSLSTVKFTPELIQMVPTAIAQRHRIVPVKFENDTLTVAMSDALNLMAIDSLRLILKCNIEGVMATDDDINITLDKYYHLTETVDTMVQELSEEELEVSGVKKEAGVTEDEDAPIIKLVSLLILEAFRSRASDIHIEPMENKFRIRYRIDGVLHEVPGPPKRLQGPVISRVKIMAGMDIAERRLPQDGRIKITVTGKDLDLRVSTLPATHGESVVMRILDKSSIMLGLEDLGFDPEDEEVFAKLIESPNGILLVTGPTGSGKTTTLYAALSTINRPNRKLITVEEPVEYQINGINQVQVKSQIGLTFANGLRAMLRQAPDVIMVGEIRDFETAGIAIQAALTGHLVFSTLHTNDAPGAVTRLVDMGVKPYLVASAVQAVMAQRLVRTLCKHCREEYIPRPDEVKALRLPPEATKDVKLYRGKGCEECGHTGYRGRKGIFELFVINDKVRELIFERASSHTIRDRARELGMKTLREDGIRKVLIGRTTLEEVVRVTQGDIE